MMIVDSVLLEFVKLSASEYLVKNKDGSSEIQFYFPGTLKLNEKDIEYLTNRIGGIVDKKVSWFKFSDGKIYLHVLEEEKKASDEVPKEVLEDNREKIFENNIKDIILYKWYVSENNKYGLTNGNVYIDLYVPESELPDKKTREKIVSDALYLKVTETYCYAYGNSKILLVYLVEDNNKVIDKIRFVNEYVGNCTNPTNISISCRDVDYVTCAKLVEKVKLANSRASMKFEDGCIKVTIE